MKRTKYELPRIPSESEELFIGHIQGTHDNYGLSEDLLAILCNTNNRTIRKWKERYNNFKYIGYTPIGKIHTIKNSKGKSLYKLVRPDSRYVRQFQLKAKHNEICGRIENLNTERILGKIQLHGQMSSYDIMDMDYDELIELQQRIEGELDD